MAYDDGMSELYVTNWVTNNVSVLSDAGSVITISSFAASPSSLTEGSTAMIDVSASGGDGQLTYAYTGLPPGCSTDDVSSLACTPVEAGDFTITVSVSDSTSWDLATATAALNVTYQSTGQETTELVIAFVAVALLAPTIAVLVVVRRRKR
jgi:hypothetical protein